MSDSEKSPNASGSHDGEAALIDLPPDPDAHLSESERAAVVSFTIFHNRVSYA